MATLTGIPGSVSDTAKGIRWRMVRDDSAAAGYFCRAYHAAVSDGNLFAIVSRDEVEPGLSLWHVSVHHSDRERRPDRCPDWDELKLAAYRLVPDDVPLILIFPRRSTPKEQYVDFHPTTLHLWETKEDVDR